MLITKDSSKEHSDRLPEVSPMHIGSRFVRSNETKMD